jgi:hypothetical protein
MPWLRTEDGRLVNLDRVELIAWREHPRYSGDYPGVVAWLPAGAGDEGSSVRLAVAFSEEEAQELIDAIAAWLAGGAQGVFDAALGRPLDEGGNVV